MTQAKDLIHKWHEVINSDDMNALDNIIAEEAVFSSPVVFTPMEGKEITMMYLHAAGQSFNMEKFRYTKEIHDGMNSVLEFETYIDDISVNGIDMIEWNQDGMISNFKVMIRPFKAVQKVQEKMIEALESLD
ncbi:MAG: nuclear transport factor 2 family protein [Gammaproteobacteria bacterium]|tara:strand:+ start:586 stop:981 length:396 start_codon:yes stop_codon:yes gene_type:complete